MKFLYQLLLLACLSALAGAAWVGHRAVDLPTVAEADEGQGKKRDVLEELRQAAIKRSALVELSEMEINRHLGTALGGRLASSLQRWVAFDRLAVDLEDGIAHIILQWKVGGRPRTVTVDFVVTRLEEEFRIEVTGGGYGHLRMPRGLMRPMRPALVALGGVLEPEIQALFQMNQVQIVKDKLVLDPRF